MPLATQLAGYAKRTSENYNDAPSAKTFKGLLKTGNLSIESPPNYFEPGGVNDKGTSLLPNVGPKNVSFSIPADFTIPAGVSAEAELMGDMLKTTFDYASVTTSIAITGNNSFDAASGLDVFAGFDWIRPYGAWNAANLNKIFWIDTVSATNITVKGTSPLTDEGSSSKQLYAGRFKNGSVSKIDGWIELVNNTTASEENYVLAKGVVPTGMQLQFPVSGNAQISWSFIGSDVVAGSSQYSAATYDTSGKNPILSAISHGYQAFLGSGNDTETIGNMLNFNFNLNAGHVTAPPGFGSGGSASDYANNAFTSPGGTFEIIDPTHTVYADGDTAYPMGVSFKDSDNNIIMFFFHNATYRANDRRGDSNLVVAGDYRIGEDTTGDMVSIYLFHATPYEP